MAEILIRRGLPDQDLDDFGLIYDDVAGQIVGFYGQNDTEDTLTISYALGALTEIFVLAPFTKTRQRVDLGGSRRIACRPARGGDHVWQRQSGWVLGGNVTVHQEVTNPRRSSPVVLSRAYTEFFSSATTTHNVPMPATVTAGDLLDSIFLNTGTATVTATGFTSRGTQTNTDRQTHFEKSAVGTEDGTNVNHLTSANAFAIAHVRRIEAGSWSGDVADIEVTFATGTASTPNPPAHTPTGGSADYLWIVAGTKVSGTITAAPTNYTGLVNGSGGDNMGSAERVLTASTTDPGTFAGSTSAAYIAATKSIPPVGGTPATVTPATVAITATAPTAAALGAALVTPSAVAAVATSPTPVILAASIVTPAAVAAVATAPTPTIDIAPFANPDTVAAVGTVPTPGITAGAVVEPLTVDAIAAVPTPGITLDAIVNPQTVPAVATAPTPGVLAASVVTPDPVAAVADVPTPTPSIPGSGAPAVVAILATVPTPTITAGATVTPMVVAINVSVPTASIFAGVLAIIARVIGQFHRKDTNRLHLAKIGRGNRRGFRIQEGWERVSDPFVYDEHTDGLADQEATMAAVAAAWAAHAGASEATLKAAIHTALDNLGYRRPDGTRLV
jgi:hypothetical protein